MKSLRREAVFVFLCVFIVTLLFSLTNQARAQTGSLYLSPSSGQVAAGQSFSLALRVNTGGAAINAAEGSIVFDQAKLSVSSISKSGSVFTIWASEPEFSNAEGTIEFAGGIPNPGYSGSNGLVLNITFKAKTATTIRGSTEITIVSGGILANDGYGTNILSSLGKAVYSITPSSISEPEGDSPPISVPKPSIRSTTHPQEDKWYSNPNPLFKWNVPSGIDGVWLVLSKRSNSPPIIKYSPPISEKLLTDVEDGEWYLNARFADSGSLSPVTSFKFNIDTKAPQDFDIIRLDNEDPTNPRPELLFESSDSTSGVERYEMKIGSADWLKIDPADAGRSYHIPIQEFGSKEIEIRALDKAGNSTSSKLTVQIDPIEQPIIENITAEIENGGVITVRGVAKPGSKVSIFFRPKEKISLIKTSYAQEIEAEFETTADENGKWFIEVKNLPPGQYDVFAVSEDSRGAVSAESNYVSTRVKGGWIEKISYIFDRFINLISEFGLLILFLAVIVGIAAFTYEVITGHIRVRTGQSGKIFAHKRNNGRFVKKLHLMIKNTNRELAFLDSISHKRKLMTEEKYLKARLEQYQKLLEKFHGQFEDITSEGTKS